MQSADTQRVEAFIEKWRHSEGNEDANAKPFFSELCQALDVDGPPPKGSPGSDDYCFERAIKFYSQKGRAVSAPIFIRPTAF
ncbi:hypothetical protein [Halomicronema sp. CCY15110]|uniref:hypothetical protein n=1 Tax=Halomicronema sp. CCY15110 TaxID=2767773 RepID=UPI00194F5235|nr:hypothetical protein [Halomicronema sp. CCY15110]